MTETVRELVDQFDSMSEAERQEVLVEMLRRAAVGEHDLPDDVDLLTAADEVFRELDRPARERSMISPNRGAVWLVDLAAHDVGLVGNRREADAATATATATGRQVMPSPAAVDVAIGNISTAAALLVITLINTTVVSTMPASIPAAPQPPNSATTTRAVSPGSDPAGRGGRAGESPHPNHRDGRRDRGELEHAERSLSRVRQQPGHDEVRRCPDQGHHPAEGGP